MTNDPCFALLLTHSHSDGADFVDADNCVIEFSSGNLGDMNQTFPDLDDRAFDLFT